MIIKEGGEVYDYWLDPPVPIYMQFYMFNVTNHEEVLQGEKPSVTQSGPYTYRFGLIITPEYLIASDDIFIIIYILHVTHSSR